jgi:hypothetical protein
MTESSPNFRFSKTAGQVHVPFPSLAIVSERSSPSRACFAVPAEEIDGAAAYASAEFLADVRRGIWSEAYSGSQIRLWRRNLQRSYLELMASRLYGAGGGESVRTG